ncbi:Putative Holin-X, holin superfamily III [Erythrobacter litoralis]|nr:phage holin family protein [Erythrobacter litoralis]AOL23616.1 Putative Holin-X, holin superfamily III [Erythrobacter litoralis]MEE4337099.1 phage holin family protein [Erythrobacter sp.]
MSEARTAPGQDPGTLARDPRAADEALPPDSPNGIEDPFDPSGAPIDMPADPTTVGPPEEGLSESLTEELAALIDDGRTYVSAELNFQKTRASLAGKNAGIALGLAIVAVVVLHVAVLALAVGLVMALAPLVTIWGAIAIVVGGLLAVTGLLGWKAAKHGQRIGAIFANDDPPAAAGEE